MGALAVVGWGSVVAGVMVTLVGLLLIGAIFSGGGVPVGGAGAFAVLTLGAGPALVLAGPVVIFLAVKLMGGQAWAGPWLERFYWLVVAVSVGYLVYGWLEITLFESRHFVQGVVFFALTGGPATAMALLLRFMLR